MAKQVWRDGLAEARALRRLAGKLDRATRGRRLGALAGEETVPGALDFQQARRTASSFGESIK